MILKNLLRRRTRSMLTLLGVSIGVAAFVALNGLAEGFVNSYGTILTSSGADIILAQSDAPDILFSAVDANVGAQVAAMPQVRQVSGVMLGMVTTPDVPYFFIFGLDPKEFGIRHYKVVEGQPLLGSRQLLMGRTAQRNFHKKIGDYYRVQEVSFRIVGIYESGQAIEENGAVISLRDAQAVFKKPSQVAYYQIQVQRPETIPGVIKGLEQRFPKLSASRSASYMDSQQETAMLRAMGWFIGLLAVVAGGLGMMNTMLMSVFERTREIGVLRALGWRSSRIVRMIMGEAILLSVLGGAAGNAMGAGLIAALNQVPVLAGFMDGAYSFALFSQAMIIAVVLGAVGGAYPAWRAAHLLPVEAMRYDGGVAGDSRSRRRGGRFAGRPAGSLRLPGGIALRNLLRQRTRTVLTMLAIGVGVGLLVALGGMGEGVLQQYAAIGGQTGELTITETKASDLSLATIDEKVGRYAASLPAVQSVSGMLIGFASTPDMPYFLAFGFDPTSFAMGHFAVGEGDRIHGPREILMGTVAAKNAKKKVGDHIQILDTNYRIVGIYETGISYEDAAGVMSLSEVQRLFKRPNQVTTYGIKLKDPDQAEAVRSSIQTRFPQVTVSRSSEFADKLNDTNSFRAMTNALTLISIIVGGVGMMNAMLMSVNERTREIGTLRALGWRRRRVIGMILREAVLLSLLSGAAGIVFGIGLGWLLGLEPTMGPYLKGVYSPTLLMQAMGIAILLGAIGAVYPAWRASNLSPIEALRYE